MLCVYFIYIFLRKKSKTSGLTAGLNHVPNAVFFDLSGVSKISPPLFTYIM